MGGGDYPSPKEAWTLALAPTCTVGPSPHRPGCFIPSTFQKQTPEMTLGPGGERGGPRTT